MFFTVLSILQVSLSSSSDYFLITSSKTSPSLLQEFSQALKISQTVNLSEPLDPIFSKNPSNSKIFVDLSNSPEFFPVLDELSDLHCTFYLTFTKTILQSYSSFRFYLRASIENEVKTIIELISYLQWNQFNIYSTSSQVDLEVSERVKKTFFPKIQSFLTLVENISDFSLDSIVKKSLKAAGVRKMLIVGGQDQLARLQDFILRRKLEVKGSQFLFSPDGIYSAYLNGSIIIAYQGTEEVTSEEALSLKLVENILKRSSSEDLKSYLKSFCPGNICNQFFSIVNIQSGVRTIVGTFNGSLFFDLPLLFPGGTVLKVMNTSSTPILVSIANGTSEPYSTVKDYSYASIYKGAEYGVFRSNFFKEIPNFHLELLPTDCGNSYPDEEWYLKCFSSLKGKLGVTYLTSLSSGSANVSYNTLKSVNYQIPQLIPMSTLEFLSDKSEFPFLLKLAISNFDFGESFLLFLLSFNWKSIIYFGSEDAPYHSQYLEYLKIIESINIQIVNPVETRLFPGNYSSQDFEKYKSFFLFVKKVKCRIFLLSTPYSADILEGFYDVGLRKEDVIVLSGMSIYYSMGTLVSEERLRKRKEFLNSIFVFTYKEWVGELGEQLYTEISAYVPYTPTYLCVTYDTISVLKSSIIHLLTLGEDYEDPSILMSSLRTQRLTGCMGSIYFLHDSNVVATFKLGLGKMAFNDSSGQLLITYFATSNKYDTTIIQYSKPVEWPDGTTETPSNFIDFGKCGLDERLVKTSKSGRTAKIAVAVSSLGISVISAVVSAKVFKSDLQVITEGQLPFFADHLTIGYMAFSCFQVLALLGDDGIFEFVGIQEQKLIGFNLVSYYQLKQEKYWTFLRIVLFFTAFYNISAVFYFLVRRTRLVFTKIHDFFYYFLPTFGHLLFLPVVSLLMTIFSCSESTGSSLTESFLDFDCQVFCYSGSHRIYSVLSFTSLSLYLIISIFFRPYWEIQQKSLNIRTKVSFLSFLSIFQVAIAMLASVKPFNQSFTEFLIAALLFLFAVLLLRTRPYNYQRALAYHLVFLLLTFWSVLLTASFRFFDGIIVVSLMFIGAGVLAAVGVLVIDKLPKELANSKVVEIHQLFRMLFSKASVYEVKTSDSGLMVTSQQAENKDKTFGNVSLMKIGEVLHKSVNVNY